MKENNNGENSQVEILMLEKQIRKTHFYTAVVVLIGAILTTFATSWTVKTGIESLREKEKPLEGLWNYHGEYEKWYDEKDPHELTADGKAIMIWKDKDERYDIYISYKITRSAQEFPLLALSTKGIFSSGSSTGYPDNKNFLMDNFEIIARVHYEKKVRQHDYIDLLIVLTMPTMMT